MEILGHGVYSLPDAAKLTRLKPQRVREWFAGGRSAGARASVFQSDYQSLGGDRAISFHDLIELFIAGQLRDHGVSLQTLRKVYKRLQADLGTRHPFCRREIMTKDGQVFLFGLDARGTEEMIEVLTQQRVFPDILLPFLRKMDYDEATEMAARWCIANMVVIYPKIGFGKPTIDGVGISTAILAASYEANDRDAERVADWFKVHATHVLAAVDFERNLAA
jgi:uncharacterized protein (DUF433 family)